MGVERPLSPGGPRVLRAPRSLDSRRAGFALAAAIVGICASLATRGGLLRANAAEPVVEAPPALLTRSNRLPIPAKIMRYAERLVRQYDANRDGSLQQEEWQKIRGSPRMVDTNRDGVITVDEFTEYISRYGQSHRIHLLQPTAETMPPPSLFRPSGSGPSSDAARDETAEPEPVSIDSVPEMPAPAAAEDASDRIVRRAPRPNRKFHVSRASLPPGLPDWFMVRDANGDGQISMAEYAPSPSRADILQFNRIDTNRDGVLTARELVGLGKPAARNADPPPR